MERKIYFNTKLRDTATFIKTSEETNGDCTIIEIILDKSEGPPLHFHKAFSETFEVMEGTLSVQAGRKHLLLRPGETYTVSPYTAHRFYNTSNDRVRFWATLRPGHAGMENFIKIFYGLAADGLTNDKGQPRNFKHLAVAVIMSDSYRPGLMALFSPLLKRAASKAKKDGTEHWLLTKYCT